MRSRTFAPAVLALAACASPARPPAPPAAPVASRYDDPSAWLCLPGRADACAGDLSATVVHADGSRSIEPSVPPATDPKVDCFYVYPTVDASTAPGNHEDFTDIEPMAGAALTQVARLRQSCAIYAPLYRQATIGSYFKPGEAEPRLAVAFSDVEAAFRTYLARYNHGRPIVLMGHSQGADMVIRLLQRFFDHDAELRARLVLAMPIGWYVETPRGKRTGGTFENVPVCATPDEAGCVVAYRTYEAAFDVKASGHAPRGGDASVCVNPAAVGSGASAKFSRAYLRAGDRARRYLRVEDVTTPFVELDGFYQGQCLETPDGFGYLSVATAPGDARKDPVDADRLPLHRFVGMHVLDVQLLQGDLVDLVKRHAAGMR
jgi:hypothetical protein